MPMNETTVTGHEIRSNLTRGTPRVRDIATRVAPPTPRWAERVAGFRYCALKVLVTSLT